MLDTVAQPNQPAILKNQIVEYCMEYNLQRKPYHRLIIYDFETVENVINNQISLSTQFNSTLIPISVASCIHNVSGKQVTIHFDTRDNDFIPKWIAAFVIIVQ